MSPTFTDEDVGKPVERADGTVIGTVESVEGERARVEPAPDAIDTIKARLGWDEIGEPFTLEAEAVDDVTVDRVHLEEGFSADGSRTAREPDSGDERTTSQDRRGTETTDERGSPQPDR